MSWLERRRQENELIHLAERYGRALYPFDFPTSRREKIELGRKVLKDMALFQRMRDAGVVTKFDGVEMPSLPAMIEAMETGAD